VNSIVGGLTHLSGWVAYAVIGALIFGKTAVFLGFVLPGETAVVLGGVLASRGHLSLARPPLRHRPTPRPVHDRGDFAHVLRK